MICRSDTFVSNHFSRMLHNQAGAGVSPLQLSAYPTVKGIYNLLKSQPSANCEPFSHPLFDTPGNASKMWRVNPGRLSAVFQSASLWLWHSPYQSAHGFLSWQAPTFGGSYCAALRCLARRCFRGERCPPEKSPGWYPRLELDV